MKTFLRITAAVAMATACMAATAQSAGTWSVRLGATRIDPQTSSGWLSTPSVPDTRVDVKANSQLTGGVTYMVTNNWAIDVPMGLPFKHDFVGNGAISGTPTAIGTATFDVTATTSQRAWNNAPRSPPTEPSSLRPPHRAVTTQRSSRP